MKNQFLSGLFVTLCLVCFAGGAVSLAAQPTKKKGPAVEQTRDMVKQYKAGKVDGVQVVIYLIGANGSRTPVAPTYVFGDNDEVKFSVRSNFRGYVYLVNQGASGKYRLLFPGSQEPNLIKPGEERVLPSDYAITLDQNRGTEIVQVYLSKQRIPFFEVIARQKDDGLLNEGQVAQLQKLWKSSDANLPGVLKMETVNTGKQGVLRVLETLYHSDVPKVPVRKSVLVVETRDPIFDLPKKTTLVVIERPKKAAPKYTAVSGFSINLKHGR